MWFIWLWATFQSLWKQFNLLKSPTFLCNLCEGVKIFNFSSEIILGNFYRHLATFYWSHSSHHHQRDDPSCHFCCSSKTGFGHEKIRSASIAFFKLGFCFNFGLYHKIEASFWPLSKGQCCEKYFDWPMSNGKASWASSCEFESRHRILDECIDHFDLLLKEGVPTLFNPPNDFK